MTNRLNQLNFNDLLIVDTDVNTYDFNVYMRNEKHLLKGFCTKCEEKSCNVCPTDNTFRLQNISHGATTQDILLATDQNNVDFTDWHHDGVVFLMEGPSTDWGQYEEMEFNGYRKKPSREWYWVHDKQEKWIYPLKFKGGLYGALFNSLTFTFKLQNAYLTNLVKCGLNNQANGYKGIDDYDNKCLETCVESYLLKELEIVQPKVVFCFGSKVLTYLDELYPEEYPFLVVGLPHPAGKRRGFKNEYYRHLYFTSVLEGLYKAGMYTLEEAKSKFEEFLVSAPKHI